MKVHASALWGKFTIDFFDWWREGVARLRQGRVISYVQVLYPDSEVAGDWVTVGFGTAEAAHHLAAGVFQSVRSSGGDLPVGVRVRAEHDMTPREVEVANADIGRQAAV